MSNTKTTERRSSEICVCCGDPVPEGRMVCVWCENGNKPKNTSQDFLDTLWKKLKTPYDRGQRVRRE